MKLTVVEFLVPTTIILLLGFVLIGSFISAEHKAAVWNRCHPNVPISTAEAWWITDLQLDECEVPNE